MITVPFQIRLQSLLSDVAEMLPELPIVAALRQRFGRSPMPIEDITENGRYEVRAQIPGVDPTSDVEITTDDGWLTIAAERTQKTAPTGRSEFWYGWVARSVQLPDGANPDGITTSYDKGILSVSLPVEESMAEPAAESDAGAPVTA
jgi:HSP20 family protein